MVFEVKNKDQALSVINYMTQNDLDYSATDNNVEMLYYRATILKQFIFLQEFNDELKDWFISLDDKQRYNIRERIIKESTQKIIDAFLFSELGNEIYEIVNDIAWSIYSEKHKKEGD